MVAMSSEIDRAFPELSERSLTRHKDIKEGVGPSLEVNVVFTTVQGILAALRTAGGWAHDWSSLIRLVVPEVVPYPLPLERPPVSVDFTRRRFLKMTGACPDAVEIHVHLYFCRERQRCLLQVLKPRSVVVMGGRKRWWPTGEHKLASVLRSRGHQVVFVDLKSGSHARSILSFSAAPIFLSVLC